MNHFAEAEDLLKRAGECVVDSITRNLVARAAVHAALAQVQVLEDAHGLPPAAFVPAQVVDDRLAIHGIETKPATGERL